MHRREFVRAVVVTGIAPGLLLGQQGQQATTPAPPPPAPVPWTLGLNAKTPLPHTQVVDGIAQAELHFFTQQRMATLVRLCDLMMPPLGGMPGAVDADTPLFLDFLLNESPDARKQLYAGGLDWLEATARRRYKSAFAALDQIQADALIRPWLRTWMTDHPPTEPHAGFLNIAHDDIRTATTNSKAWDQALITAGASVTADLYWYPIDPDLHGDRAVCALTPPRTVAAPKASHTMPSYPR
jgi:hypothetical protein